MAWLMMALLWFLAAGGEAYAASSSKYLVYKVKRGDSVYKVARLFGLDEETIIACNSLTKPYTLHVGQKLNIPNPKYKYLSSKIPVKSASSSSSNQILYTVAKGDTLAAIARKYNTGIELIAQMNKLKAPYVIHPGDKLLVRRNYRGSSSGSSSVSKPGGGGRVSEGGASSGGGHGSSGGSAPSSGKIAFNWPVSGPIIQKFSATGYFRHLGIQIAVPENTSVKAARSGTVIYSDNSIPGYGNMIIIDHHNEYYSVYAHNKANLVRVDQKVAAGTTIAKVGKRPQDDRHNLYFEIRFKGKAINPEPYLRN